jgi:dienelactone hydrolase
MKPVVVDRCFGWLHAVDSQQRGDVAVLICPGLGRDRLDAHHAIRQLADELAMAGYPAMRLDYPGTGDAGELVGGEASSDGHWTLWQQSVGAALDWLRAATGAQRVVLIGLRIGGMLATLVAEQRGDVAGLVLLAPVLLGRSYIRQLQIAAEREPYTDASAAGGLNFHDVQFSAETVRLMSAADLRQARLPPGLRVAMFGAPSSGLGNDCVRAWTERGVVVVRASFDGLGPMLAHNQETEGAPTDFSSVLDWIRRTVPAGLATAASVAWPAPSLAQPGWIETPQQFGAGDRLFGMLCEPDGQAGDVAVIITNTGRDPHYGFARFGVEFARRLAREGVASLRIDFAGLGDSVGPAGKESVLSAIYESDRAPDIRAAVDVLARRGYRQIAVHGLCSGAYHALHGALADRRIGTLLLLNLPLLQWRRGDKVDFAHRRIIRPSEYALKIGNRHVWSRLLRGKLDVSEILRAQSYRLYDELRTAGLRFAEQRRWIGPRTVGRRAMAAFAQRGVRTLFLYSPDDHGINVMEQEFGRAGAGLRGFAGAEMRIVPGLDHLLSTRAMRQTVVEMMVRFLVEPHEPAGSGAAR